MKKILIPSLIVLAAALSAGGCKKGITTPESLPVIWMSETSITYTASQLGPNPGARILQIRNTGSDVLDYTISDDASFYDSDWLTVLPASGTSNGQVVEHTIVIDKSGLDAREQAYTAKITIQSSNAYNSPQRVDVTLTVTDQLPAQLEVTPARLQFTAVTGEGDPAEQTLTVRNAGDLDMVYTVASDADWLTVTPVDGTLGSGGEAGHSVLVSPSGLAEGTYSANLTVTGTDTENSPQTVPVTLTLSSVYPPEISLDTQSLAFEAQAGGSNPALQRFKVWNSGAGLLQYQIAWDAAWLTVDPASGQSNGTEKKHKVTVDISGLSEGTYSGTITVSDPDADNDPQTLSVTLTVTEEEPQPPIPSDDNEIYISLSPSSGGLGTYVQVTIGIRGNQKEIDAFGFDLHFDPAMFEFQTYTRGSLTGGYALFGLNKIADGHWRVAGVAGTGIIAGGSSGSLIVVTLAVIGNSANNIIYFSDVTDYLVYMTPAPSSAAFTFR